MKDPIFARTRYEYQSYSDFWKLVELSGFKTCYVDQMDLEAEEVFISAPVNGETRPHIFGRRELLKTAQRAKIIVWLLEKPYDPASSLPIPAQIQNGVSELLSFADEAWISDRYVASCDPRYIYVEMGSHPELARGPKEAIQYDIAHMSCSVPRRDAIYSQLLQRGVHLAPNAWGDQRDSILRRTRAMLNVHQDDTKVVEPLRMAIAAAYRLAYFTEECHDVYPLAAGVTCHEAPYALLYNAIRNWMTGDLAGMGERLYDRLCVKSNFRKGVMDALHRTFE